MKQSLQAAPARLTKIFLCALLTVCASCVKLPRRVSSVSSQSGAQAAATQSLKARRINLNTASPAELEKLPGIGRGLAARIVEHREHFGRFRRAEHLLMVRGISARRFEAVRALVIAE